MCILQTENDTVLSHSGPELLPAAGPLLCLVPAAVKAPGFVPLPCPCVPPFQPHLSSCCSSRDTRSSAVPERAQLGLMRRQLPGSARRSRRNTGRGTRCRHAGLGSEHGQRSQGWRVPGFHRAAGPHSHLPKVLLAIKITAHGSARVTNWALFIQDTSFESIPRVTQWQAIKRITIYLSKAPTSQVGVLCSADRGRSRSRSRAGLGGQ